MIRTLKLTFALLTCLTLTTAVTAATWPQFLGPNANGIAPDTGINKDWATNPPQELWRVTLSDNGYAGPSVADGKVFIIDHVGDDDVVRALDFATGDEVWSFTYAAPGKFNYGYSRSTPVYDGGKLYTLGRLGKLHCLNAATGDVIWQRNIKAEFGGILPTWYYAASPKIDGDKLLVLPGGTNVLAVLNKMTGETLWTGGGAGDPSYATPVIAQIQGGKQYVVFLGDKLIGINAESGQRLWEFPWATSNKVNAAAPVVGGNYIFAASGYGFGCGLLEITPEGPVEIYHTKDIIAHFSSPVFYNHYVFGIGDPGFLVCMDSREGNVMWKQAGFEKGGLVAVDGTIIAMDGKNGDIVMVEASSAAYNELGRIKPLGGQSWTAPIISDGKLIVRNKTEMVCLDLM